VALLWVALATIAAQLWPIPARAHNGRTHGAHAISILAPDHANNGAIQNNAQHANAGQAEGITEVAIAGVDIGIRAAPPATCNGDCCASGFSCCAPVMLSEAAADWPNCVRALKVVRLRTPNRPGIDPETLPRPPKSFT
jgi:hypothetical protein